MNFVSTAGNAFRRAGFGLVAALCLVGTMKAGAAQPDYQNVVGPVACSECHQNETKIWEATHHFATFREMPRKEKAMEIANKMGFKRIKAGSLCLDCHFLTSEVEGEREAVAGIACESCHGAGKSYIDVHSANFDKGNKQIKEETPEQEAKRWAAAEAGGMIRPKNLYALAKNCYGCHVVPQEKLVNDGGHEPGSPFELVSWSQGEIRHNTWHSRGKTNEKATPERRRMMYIVGTAVELETALRATAKATEKATYGVTMARRADAARKRMASIVAAASTPELAEIAKIANGVALKLNNEAELTGAADQIGKLTREFVGNHDGSGLAAVDSMIPSAKDYKGEPLPVTGSGN